MTNNRTEDRRTIIMAEFPEKQFYTTEELDALDLGAAPAAPVTQADQRLQGLTFDGEMSFSYQVN
jgi:hypothetical protein